MSFYQLDAEVSPESVGMDGAVVNQMIAMFRNAIEDQTLFAGAQLAVFRNGKRVVDVGGGMARVSDQTPVRPETMFTLYSSTKGLAALCMHMLHDR